MKHLYPLVIVLAVLFAGVTHVTAESPTLLWAKQESQLEDENGRPIGRVQMGDILLGKETSESRVKVIPNALGEECTAGWLPIQHVLSQDAAVEYFSNCVETDPKNSRAYFGRAIALHAIGSPVGTFSRVMDDLATSLRIAPEFAEARYWHAAIQIKQKQFKAAINDYTTIIEQGHETARMFAGRGFCWLALWNPEKALEDVNRAIKLDPKEAAYYHGRSVVFLIAGQPANALQDIKMVRKFEIEANEEVSSVEVVALLDSGMYDKAVEVGRKLTEQFPTYPNAYAMLATAQFAKGDCLDAIRMYDRALEEQPDALMALNGKAWILATCHDANLRDGKAAVQLAKVASRLMNHTFWPALTTLAAAHAEVSDFGEAVQCQRKAIELAPKGKKEQLKQVLKLYESGTPFRSKISGDQPPWDWVLQFTVVE